MSNVYLEKIALTTEDAKKARRSGDKAFRKTEAKGTAVGATLGAGFGATKWYNSSVKTGLAAQLSRKGLSSKKIRALHAVAGAIPGTVIGSALSQPFATDSRSKAHTKAINQHLKKSAAVTTTQVSKRNDKNDATRGLYAIGGQTAGAAIGLGTVSSVAMHRGMKEGGGYSAIRQKAKNSMAAKKHTKSLGGNASLMGPEKSVSPHIDGRGVGKKVGTTFGRVMRRAGLLGTVAGAVGGATLAVNSANKKLDAADAKYYSNLNKKAK